MSDKGFIIKCKTCGKEEEFKKEFVNTYKRRKINIGVDWRYEDGEVGCECGNNIEF